MKHDFVKQKIGVQGFLPFCKMKLVFGLSCVNPLEGTRCKGFITRTTPGL